MGNYLSSLFNPCNVTITQIKDAYQLSSDANCPVCGWKVSNHANPDPQRNMETVKLSPRNTAFFNHIRANPPPKNFGTAHRLPQGIHFPFISQTDDLSSVLIVRECFESIISIISKKLAETCMHSCILLTGAEGNGKTWLSLYIAWVIISLGRTVVYENRDMGRVFVINKSGRLRYKTCLDCVMHRIPELDDPETVHILDATVTTNRGSFLGPEPALSRATLLIFSQNCENYRQICRRPDVSFYSIPSYTVDELKHYGHLFNVMDDEVERRCALVEPSIRYGLVNNFEQCLHIAESRIARQVMRDTIKRYLNRTVSDDTTDISSVSDKIAKKPRNF